MKKKTLFIALVIAMIFAIMTGMAFADGTETCEYSTWTPWKASEHNNELPSSGGNYYLAEDVTLSETWTVPGTKDVPTATNLCLNGHVINANGRAFSVITIPEGATLELYDCETRSETERTHAGYIDKDGLWHLAAEGHPTTDETNKEITGGIITGGKGTDCVSQPRQCGCGVFVNGGTFKLYKGNIVGNHASAQGGGVDVLGGTFKMYGGRILYNKTTTNISSAGGGVSVGYYNSSSSFNLYDGEISFNSSDHGGGIYNWDGAVNIEGGTISGNKVTGYGGGVYNYKGAITMSGGEITDNNSSQGAGVYINNNSISVTLGVTAKISGNKKGTLSGKEWTNLSDNNLYLESGKTITLGTKTGDNAETVGNGVAVPVSEMSVGVTMQNAGGVFIDGLTEDTYKACFTSDNQNYYVAKDGNNGLELKTKWSALGTALNLASPASVAGLFDVESTTDPAGYKIKLQTDFTAGSTDTTLTVNGNKTLDLNGHVINANGKSFSVITINNGATLTLQDSNPSATHTFKENNTGLWGTGDGFTGDSHTVFGGVITGGNSNYGGGVYVVSGTFVMNGGMIAGCSATHGGGVYVYSGTFTMNKGSIVSNTANSHGGGIFVGGGAIVSILDGTIEENSALQSGGAAHVDGNFTMSSGTIQKNYAHGDGGGLSVNGTVMLTGAAKILNNSADGSGGAVNYYGGSMTLGGSVQIKSNVKGGTISNGELTGGIANNVCLFYDTNKIAIGSGDNAPAEGMLVGITRGTTGEGQFTVNGNGTADQVAYFFSDNSEYYVNFNDDYDYLELKEILDEDKYDLFVDGVQVNAYTCGDVLHDGGSVIYDDDTNTLTLKNAHIAIKGTAQGLVDSSNGVVGIGRSTCTDLTICLEGNNQIGKDNKNEKGKTSFSVDRGIYSTGDIIITGDGDLTIYDYCDGIQADDVEFDKEFSGLLTVVDCGLQESQSQPPCAISALDNVTINGGKFNLTSYNSNGIYAQNGDVTIKNAEVNVSSLGDNADAIYGCKSVEIIDSYVKAESKCFGINSSKMSISGDKSKVTVSGEIGIGSTDLSTLSITGGITKIKGSVYAVQVFSEDALPLSIGESMEIKNASMATGFSEDEEPNYVFTPITGETTEFGFKEDDAYYGILKAANADDYVTIQPKTQSAPENGEGYTIDYAKETVTIEDGYEISKANDPSFAAETLTDASMPITPGTNYYIRKAGVKLLPSPATAFTTPTRPAAPTEVVAVQEVFVHDDAYLKNLDAGMEYSMSLDGSTYYGWNAWSSDAGSSFAIGLSNSNIDKYYCRVRYRATDTNFASANADFEFTASTTYRFAIGDGGYDTLTDAIAAVKNNETIKFNTNAKEGAIEIARDVTFKLNLNGKNMTGTEIKAGSGYVLSKSGTGEITYSVRRRSSGGYSVPEPVIPEFKNPFVDVLAKDYFYDSVLWAAENNITAGTDATHFSPDGTTTRAQMITFLWRMAGSPVFEDDDIKFTDINKSDYFYNAVVWGWNMGIVNGKTESLFAPYDNLRRGEAVTFIYRYAKVAGGDLPNPFNDVKQGAFYYYPVLWAANNNITSGTSVTTFNPSGDCTRGQVISFLYRYYNQFGIEK